MAQARGFPLRIFLGLVVGAALGLLARATLADTPALSWLVANLAQPLGQIFLRLVFMAVIPLVMSALILGVTEIGDVGRVGRIGLRTLILTLILSSAAVIVGVASVNWIRPGEGLSAESQAQLIQSLQGQALVQKSLETAKQAKPWAQTLVELLPRNPFQEAVNAFEGGLLPLMVFSLIAGLAMAVLGEEQTRPLKEFLNAVLALMLKIIDFAMLLAPFGVGGLIFAVTTTVGGEALSLLLKYVLVVLGALAFQLLVIYPLVLRTLAHQGPLAFLRRISEVMLTAFATSSSNATLPVSLRVSAENLKIPRPIGNFVLTVGATANQNGTALYEGVTVLFLAQVFGLTLTLEQQILVVVWSVLAGVGTAGVPGGSLPMIVVVLQYAGVPGEAIGLILGVDRLLDMARTVLNVVGDLTIAACVATWEAEVERD